jgi:hypothetical protein
VLVDLNQLRGPQNQYGGKVIRHGIVGDLPIFGCSVVLGVCPVKHFKTSSIDPLQDLLKEHTGQKSKPSESDFQVSFSQDGRINKSITTTVGSVELGFLLFFVSFSVSNAYETPQI